MVPLENERKNTRKGYVLIINLISVKVYHNIYKQRFFSKILIWINAYILS